MIKTFYNIFRLTLLFGIFLIGSCIHKRSSEDRDLTRTDGGLGCDSLGDQAIISQCHLNEINRKIAACTKQGNLYIWDNGECIKKKSPE